MKKITYSEPADYFPKEIRKSCKIGEYAEKSKKEKPTNKGKKKK